MLAVAGALAILIGLAVGILGGGGSILTTPLLVYVMGFDTKDAIAASLFVVGVTSAFGLISHARGHRVRWRTGLIFGSAGMVGAFIGGQVGSHLPGAVLMAAFAVMMGVTAIAMIRVRPKIKAKSHKGLPIFRILLDGAVVGFVTGLVGAGGGFLVVPALAILGGMPMPIAVGTSLLVVMMKSTAGFLGYAVTFGNGSFVSWNPAVQIAGDSPVQAIEVLAGVLLMLALIIFLLRWPAKEPLADFDDPAGAAEFDVKTDRG